jgi:colanic acid biosynthesis glycosyl transferase WcaI
MSLKKNLLFGKNYNPKKTGIGYYNCEFINWLGSKNFDCSVLKSYTNYPFWKIQELYARNFFCYILKIEQIYFCENLINIYRFLYDVPENCNGLNKELV